MCGHVDTDRGSDVQRTGCGMNEEKRTEIAITGVDREAIGMTSGKDCLWIVPFKLSSVPDADWSRRFYEVIDKDKSAVKRKQQLTEGVIRVEVGESDDLQVVLDALKKNVAATEVLCEGDFQKRMGFRRELAALQQKQGDVTRKLRNGADNLRF